MLKDAKGGNAKGILPRARAWPPARLPSAVPSIEKTF